MSRSATALIRFSPNAGSDDGADALDRLSLTLAVRLDGLTMTSTTGHRLHALLTIPFAPQGLCSRARFVGISPMGHAPLVLTGASYIGSTCGYSNPATDVFHAYSDSAYSDADPGETLAIGFPAENLFNFFHWPWAVVEYVPPLGEEEAPAPIALELAGLESLSGEDDLGVRLPMRLFLGGTEIRALIYQDAPSFTGSGTSVTCKLPDSIDPKPPDGAIFAVTGRDLAQAAGALALTQPVDYDLYWRIYHGSGDMLYRAKCIDATLGEEYRDRRNAGIGGGFGTFETTDLLVAKVRVEPQPLPFLITTATGKLGVGCDGRTRAATDLLAGDGRWVGTINGAEVALTWSINTIYFAGRIVPVTVARVGCACVVVDALGQECLQYVSLTSSAAQIWRLPFVAGVGASYLTSTSRPSVGGGRITPTGNYAFSSDGTRLLAYDTLADDPYTLARYPGKVWEATLTESVARGEDDVEFVIASLSPWSVRRELNYLGSFVTSGDIKPPPTTVITGGQYDFTADASGDYHTVYTGAASVLVAAFYRDNTLVVRTLDAEVAYREETQVSDIRQYVTGVSQAVGLDISYPLVAVLDASDTSRTTTLTETQTLMVRDNDAVVCEIEATQHSQETVYEAHSALAAIPAGVYWDDPLHPVPPDYANLPAAPSPRTGTTTNTVTGARVQRAIGILRSPDPAYAVALTETTLWGEGGHGAEADQTLRLFVPDGGTAREVVTLPWVHLSSANASTWPSRPEGSVEAHANEFLARDLLRQRLQHATQDYAGFVRSVQAGGCHLYTLAGDDPPTIQMVLSDDATARDPRVLTVDNVTLTRATPMSPRACLFKPNPNASVPETGDPPDPPTAAELIDAHNAYRAARGLSQMTSNAILTEVIAAHVEWLKSIGTSLSHTGIDGSQPLDRAMAAGYHGDSRTHVGENLALYQVSVAQVMESWHNSPPHQANLVDSDWTEIGVVILPAVPGRYWWGVLFGHKED